MVSAAESDPATAPEERAEEESSQEAIASPVIEDSEELDYETMMEAYNKSFQNIVEGEVVTGTILKVTDSKVVVDVGFKSEGLISLHEFCDKDGNPEVKPGDQVEVLLERTEDRRGHLVISRQKAQRMKVWDVIEEAYNDQAIITGRVIERIKGGLSVDVGIRAFLPGSQVDLHPTRNLDSWCGEEISVRVIKVSKRRGNIVLSRKSVLEDEHFRLKEDTLKNLEEGKTVAGIVKNITDYGAFVDLGGIDGLLHITDMSWGRLSHPSDLFNIGDEVDVKILKFDPLEEKVSLGYKQLTGDPWTAAAKRYPTGTRINAKVVSLTDYGAFVELEEGIEGLIHISEMTWNKRIKHPSKILEVGEEVDAVVLEINADTRRISLGMKQTEPNPWDAIEEKYALNSLVTGKVRNLTEFGAFIEVEEGIEGLVHISDLSWTKKVSHPSEILEKDEEVSAVVLDVDADNQRLSLGIKQLEPDKWEEFFSRCQIGDVTTGKIVRLTTFGAFVELDEGVEGLCHVSELSDEHIDNPENHFHIGQELEMKIIKMNLLERKIGLSVKALKAGSEAAESFDYKPEQPTATIGDIAGEQLDELKKKAKQGKEDDNDKS